MEDGKPQCFHICHLPFHIRPSSSSGLLVPSPEPLIRQVSENAPNLPAIHLHGCAGHVGGSVREQECADAAELVGVAIRRRRIPVASAVSGRALVATSARRAMRSGACRSISKAT